ncbi:hypothetical protein [Listeria rocourtiae]|uniref:hypothetical protein n=1 Tax=Listeria rocourtiae TaxID=647910 RepID=UPI0003E86481|nr:hypothetical protein [Listeria rocourtiae]EUJ44789.1 hypothetical protein PROCOU_13153 [Listeria rocourtiae FSL F6-920]
MAQKADFPDFDNGKLVKKNDYTIVLPGDKEIILPTKKKPDNEKKRFEKAGLKSRCTSKSTFPAKIQAR